MTKQQNKTKRTKQMEVGHKETFKIYNKKTNESRDLMENRKEGGYNARGN